MWRNRGTTRQAGPDTRARQPRHVSDTKNEFQLRRMPRSSYEMGDTRHLMLQRDTGWPATTTSEMTRPLATRNHFFNYRKLLFWLQEATLQMRTATSQLRFFLVVQGKATVGDPPAIHQELHRRLLQLRQLSEKPRQRVRGHHLLGAHPASLRWDDVEEPLLVAAA